MKEPSDGETETLMAVGIWFQIWGATEEKARCPKSVLALGTCRRDWLRGIQRTTVLIVGYEVIKVSRLLSGEDLV